MKILNDVHAMRTRFAPFLAAVLAAVIVLAAVMFLDRYERSLHYQELRAGALQELSGVRSRLEFILNSRLLPVEGLSSYISINPDISHKEFNDFARRIMGRQDGIHSIEIVKGSVITDYIYPLEGNEEAIGLDLMTMALEKEAILRAIALRKTVLAGPVDLVQGGEAFISRSPIFTVSGSGSHEKEKYWGLLQAIITTDSVFKEAGLYDKTSPFRIAIRGKDATGASGEVFFGDEKIFKEDPMLLDVNLFNGSWQLAALPLKGWQAVPHNLWIIRTGGLILSLLAGFLAWTLIRHPIVLEKRVEDALKALKEKEEEVKKLKEKIEMTERRRLARELNDSVGQTLLAIKLALQMMKADAKEPDSAAIEKIIKNVSGAADEIRDIVMKLRPPLIHTDGMINTLRQLSARIEEKSGVMIEITSSGSLSALDYNTKYNIFRICQEALNNVVKHSGAGSAEINLSTSGKELSLEIKDDGKGFVFDAAKGIQKGSGLSIMAERAEFLRGTFDIKTAEGQGTSIRITAPLA